MVSAIPSRESAKPVNPLVRVASNTELAKQEEAQAQARSSSSAVTGLAAEVRRIWELHKRAKQPIEIDTLRGIRQKNGEYEPEVLAQIKASGGNESFFPLTMTKCRAAISWILDIYMQPGQHPFGCTPTPIPELPPQEKAKFLAEVYETAMEEIIASGLVNDPEQISALLKQHMDTALEEFKVHAKRISKEKASLMEQAIEDMLYEGGFYEAMTDCIDDIVSHKAAIIRGPVMRKKKVGGWDANGDATVEEKIVAVFERTSWEDIYPAPGATTIQTGDLIVRHRLSRSKLYGMIGVPGYVEKNIRAALKEYGEKGNRETVWTDSEIQVLQNNGAIWANETVELHALELWGEIPGKLLQEYNIQGVDDPEKDYDVNVWIVGNYVIRAVLNPDKLGKRPYSMASFIRKVGSVWGWSLPDTVKHDAAAANTTWRAFLTNNAFSAGPLVEENVDRLAPGEVAGDIHPYKVYKVRSDQMNDAPAIRVYNIKSVTRELLEALAFIGRAADDHSGVPAYAHGNEQVGGAGNTLGGLDMLMNAASRGIKAVIQNIDTMTEGVVERTHAHIMQYGEDQSIKTGDIKIKATGSSAQLVRERQTIRRQEVLDKLNNPVDVQIVPMEGRKYLIEETLRGMDFDVEEVFPEVKQALNPLGVNPAQPAPPQGPNASVPMSDTAMRTAEISMPEGAVA